MATSSSNASLKGLLSLPSELLIRILLPFPSKDLLAWTLVSARFHDLILRILRGRLHAAAQLPHHRLMLECYHPASKNTEPYVFCDYLGTPAPSDDEDGDDGDDGNGDSDDGDDGNGDSDGRRSDSRRSAVSGLGRLRAMYSRFRPIRPDYEQRVFARHQLHRRRDDVGDGRVEESSGSSSEAGGASEAQQQQQQQYHQPPDQDQHEQSQQEQEEQEREQEIPLTHALSLDPEEYFSQRCVVTNLVKPGPWRGLFENFVNVSDGFLRIYRDWLAESAGRTDTTATATASATTAPATNTTTTPTALTATATVVQAQDQDRGPTREEVAGTSGPGKQTRAVDERCDTDAKTPTATKNKRAETLWVGSQRNVGLQLKIKERKWRRTAPVLSYADEAPHVSYYIEYEALLVRTTQLLLALEESLFRTHDGSSGKAVVFASFLGRPAAA